MNRWRKLLAITVPAFIFAGLAVAVGGRGLDTCALG